MCVCVRLPVDPRVIFCHTPSFISGLVLVQVVGFNAVQMERRREKSGQIFPEFLSKQDYANKSRGDFHSSADKTLHSNSQRGRESE